MLSGVVYMTKSKGPRTEPCLLVFHTMAMQIIVRKFQSHYAVVTSDVLVAGRLSIQ